ELRPVGECAGIVDDDCIARLRRFSGTDLHVLDLHLSRGGGSVARRGRGSAGCGFWRAGRGFCLFRRKELEEEPGKAPQTDDGCNYDERAVFHGWPRLRYRWISSIVPRR